MAECFFRPRVGSISRHEQRGIGYVPQEGALFPHLSVRQNIAFRRRARQADTADEHRRWITYWRCLKSLISLDRAHRQDLRRRSTESCLGQGDTVSPQLLLLDEPLAALDIGLKEKILPYLGRVRDEFRIPMIYVTHNLTEVLTLADWVLMIREGRLIAQGTLRGDTYVIRRQSRRSRGTTGKRLHRDIHRIGRSSRPNTSSAVIRRQELFIPYLTRPDRPPLQIRVSADDILVGTQRPEGISAGNILPGIIKSIGFLDGQAMITVIAGAEFYVRLTASAVNRLRLVEESPVFLIMKTHSLRIL